MAKGEQYLRDIAEQQIEALTAALQAQYETGQQEIGRQEATIDPRYIEQATAADVQSQKNIRKLQEIMANRGYATGQRWGQTGAMMAAGQQTQSDLGRQRQAAFDEIGRQRSGLETAYTSGLASGTAEIQNQLMQSLYNHYMATRSRGGGGGQPPAQPGTWQDYLGRLDPTFTQTPTMIPPYAPGVTPPNPGNYQYTTPTTTTLPGYLSPIPTNLPGLQ